MVAIGAMLHACMARDKPPMASHNHAMTERVRACVAAVRVDDASSIVRARLIEHHLHVMATVGDMPEHGEVLSLPLGCVLRLGRTRRSPAPRRVRAGRQGRSRKASGWWGNEQHAGVFQRKGARAQNQRCTDAPTGFASLRINAMQRMARTSIQVQRKAREFLEPHASSRHSLEVIPFLLMLFDLQSAELASIVSRCCDGDLVDDDSVIRSFRRVINMVKDGCFDGDGPFKHSEILSECKELRSCETEHARQPPRPGTGVLGRGDRDPTVRQLALHLVKNGCVQAARWPLTGFLVNDVVSQAVFHVRFRDLKHNGKIGVRRTCPCDLSHCAHIEAVFMQMGMEPKPIMSRRRVNISSLKNKLKVFMGIRGRAGQKKKARARRTRLRRNVCDDDDECDNEVMNVECNDLGVESASGDGGDDAFTVRSENSSLKFADEAPSFTTQGDDHGDGDPGDELSELLLPFESATSDPDDHRQATAAAMDCGDSDFKRFSAATTNATQALLEAEGRSMRSFSRRDAGDSFVVRVRRGERGVGIAFGGGCLLLDNRRTKTLSNTCTVDTGLMLVFMNHLFRHVDLTSVEGELDAVKKAVAAMMKDRWAHARNEFLRVAHPVKLTESACFFGDFNDLFLTTCPPLFKLKLLSTTKCEHKHCVSRLLGHDMLERGRRNDWDMDNDDSEGRAPFLSSILLDGTKVRERNVCVCVCVCDEEC